jgi:peroxiredoxin
MRIGERAPNVAFLRTDGERASLRELVGGKPTVLFFLRHYG